LFYPRATAQRFLFALRQALMARVAASEDWLMNITRYETRAYAGGRRIIDLARASNRDEMGPGGTLAPSGRAPLSDPPS
jgi:hypothetical protein